MANNVEFLRYVARVGTMDAKIGTIGNIGTLRYVSRVGSMGYMARVGSLGYLGRAGSIGSVGRVSYVPRVGSIGRIGSIGSIGRVGYVPRVGSLGRVESGSLGRIAYVGRTGTIGAHAWYKGGSVGASQWDRIHTGKGSTYVGSWVNIERFRTKTFAVRSTVSGTLSLVTGIVGSGPTGITGTYAQMRLGVGSYVALSFTEAMRFVKPIVTVGSVGSGKGTLSLAAAFHE